VQAQSRGEWRALGSGQIMLKVLMGGELRWSFEAANGKRAGTAAAAAGDGRRRTVGRGRPRTGGISANNRIATNNRDPI
jgi:hypothetical protein